MKPKLKWQPPDSWMKIKTLEMHTDGEPLRIYTEGIPEIKGKTILEKRKYFMDHLDGIRTGTIWEPRGHADMYGVIITEPETEDGHFGVIFTHNEGYSTMCGHAIIALAKMAVETGLVEASGNKQEIRIDTPAGRVTAEAILKDGVVQESRFRNVPSYVYLMEEMVDVKGIGRVHFDVAFGGAFYAFCDAMELGLNMDETDYSRIIDYGMRIKRAVAGNFTIRHPKADDLSFLYGTIFTGDPYNYKNHSRNVCVFADGAVDRSATGTGVSARAALHYARGELQINESITIESILGTTMKVKALEEVMQGSRKAIIPEVTGKSWFMGQNEFYFDPKDPLKNGFILR